MEYNTEKQANEAAQNYLNEIYADYNDGYSLDLIKILEDLRNGQGWGYEWFTPNEFRYFLSEEHIGVLCKHNIVDEDSISESIFDFHYDILFDLNKKMLDWWKSQYKAGNMEKEYYIKEICNIMYKYIDDVCLDTPEEIELFISTHPSGDYFGEYLQIKN